jgi:pimeloyl-ACP methyl ester carboxylesterase
MSARTRAPRANLVSGATRPMRRVARMILWLLAAVFTLALAGATYEVAMAAGDAERYPPPGRLVEVGGHRLHLHCVGEGTPTVVLISGLGGSSLLWQRVQTGAEPLTRVCAYDRAGIGWSDPGSAAPTPGAVAAELHALLASAAVPAPYVLVGASVGGKYARMYVAQYPQEVAGLVLVDSRHESLDATLTPEAQAAALAAAERDGRMYRWLGRLGVMRLFGARLVAATSPGAAQLDHRTATLLMLHASRPKDIDAMLAESAMMTADDERLRAAPPLGDLPLIVLAADSSLRDDGWRAGQDQQARLSTNSRLVVVDQSSHFIALDQPDAVADAIAQLVTEPRMQARGGGERSEP